MKEPEKRKAKAAKPTGPKCPSDPAVIRLDDLVPKASVRGGRKTFLGGK